MTALLCGKLEFAPASEEETVERAWALLRIAGTYGMSCQFGYGICQGSVSQMMEVASPVSETSLLFLVTDSPISDNSDRLIYPFVGGRSWMVAIEPVWRQIVGMFTEWMRLP